MTAPRFFVGPDALGGTSTILTGAELHHLRVRRLRAGSEVVLTNGSGQHRSGIVAAVNRRQALIRFTAPLQTPRERRCHLVLAQALLKGNKLDLVIEKSTELGVDELLLFRSERSIGHAPPARRARWTRIAQAAAKQCQRSTLPTIAGPIPFEELLARSDSLRLLFWENGAAGGLTTALRASPTGSVLAAVGPEGGFTATEANQATERGFRVVTLGARILRADTAALVATTLCQFLWGDLAGGDS
jgi:16S rRNA (uracil1498-N3)-methyltransferase